MPYQPTLPEPSGADLPSPLFKPQPGWGGRLNGWLRRNIYASVFRGIILAAVVLIILSFLRAPDELIVQEPTPEQGEVTSVQVAAPGEGLSQLAARALNEWLAAQESPIVLDAVQHLYAVDRMTRITVTVSGRTPAIIHTGEIVQFPHVLMNSAATEAQALTASQYRAWARLLR